MVFDDQERRVDKGDGGVDLNDPEHASMRVSLPDLSDGPYIVRWEVVLLDGDAASGEIKFNIAGTGVNPTPISDEASLGLEDQTTTGKENNLSNRRILPILGLAVLGLLVAASIIGVGIRSRRSNSG
jgi:hypothetical protein